MDSLPPLERTPQKSPTYRVSGARNYELPENIPLVSSSSGSSDDSGSEDEDDDEELDEGDNV